MLKDEENMMEHGFVDRCGNAWCDAWVDQYNEYTRVINRSAGIPDPSPMVRAERENWQDIRHRFFVSCCEIANRRGAC